MRGTRITTERGLDRLVNFSDAVVAIAITLLVLPLMDLVGEVDEVGAANLISSHTQEFGAFVMTFLVMALFWIGHHGLFELVGGYDRTLLWLDLFWLMGIVALPFGSALVSYTGFGSGAGVMYCGIMAALSALQALIAIHVRAHPELWGPEVLARDFHPGWSWAYAGFFLFVAAASLVVADAASYLLLLLIPLGRWRAMTTRKQLAEDADVPAPSAASQ